MSEAKIDSDNVRKLSRTKREVRRLRNTASFRIGLHLTNSVRNPLRLIFLPITFPIFCFYLGLERLGKVAKPKDMNQETITPGENNKQNNCENSIVLFPTNGVGFGHFTRLYSVARRLRKRDPELEIIFFTPMPTLHIPYSDDFPTYHLAGRYKHNNMTSSTWNMLVEEMLTLVFEVHKPKWFIFDGAFPYQGMLNAINQEQSMKKIWLRRGMFKKRSSIPVDSIGFFDSIIHPKDAVERTVTENIHSVNTESVSPITLIDYDEMLSRSDARNRLGIPLDCKVTYVQLGAGRINEIDSDIRVIVDCLLKDNDMYVIIGESMLGKRVNINLKRLRIIRDYPNAIYLNGIDYSVQAGGYNSFHEMRNMRLPTLFIPNLNTGMDDQLARCKIAKEEGWGVVLNAVNTNTVNEALSKIYQLKSTPKFGKNGADEISKLIVEGKL